MKTISIEFTDEAYELVEKTAKDEYLNTPEKLVEFLMMRNLNAIIHSKDKITIEPEALDLSQIMNQIKDNFGTFITPPPPTPAPQTE